MKNDKKSEIINAKSYTSLLEQIKADIQQSQMRAALSVTKELILLYWRIGKMLAEKIDKEGWGAKTIERIAKDITSAFPDVSGFSVRNLQYMKKFADYYEDLNYAAAAAQIPWGHNMLLMDKVKNSEKQLWYIGQVLKNGWSRSILEHWIDSDLYSRQGKAITNFKHTLPAPQSDLVEQVLKDPYNFSFLALDKKHRERELEEGLTEHIQRFLLELGDGFAFVGRQYKIEIEDEDYLIDLLFYHLKLRCYFIVELKTTAFDPRDVGQMNFYLSAVDDILRHSSDSPSIGILICKTRSKVKVEYALRHCRSPIGVASYETKITKSLPKNLKASLPTVEEIEAELSKDQK